MNLALIGNPNCGKTTLFNALTGTYQKVGNFAGVTVEKKDGVYKKDKSLKITDLPGLYSLSADSADERAVTEYLKTTPPDAVINVLDGTNLERNLYLTCELARLKIPVVLAVNFCDDLDKNGIVLSETALSLLFGGVPVVKISALKGTGLSELIAAARGKAKIPKLAVSVVGSAGVKAVSEAGAETGAKEGVATGAKAGSFYDFIEENIGKIIRKKETKAEKFTRRADGVLTHKYFGIPIFVAVVLFIYFAALKVGGAAGELIGAGFKSLESTTRNSLEGAGAAEWAISLLTDAVIKGVGTVLSFLPQILVLFLLLSVVEESGYAARVAFNFDRLFRSFGLSGKSLLPLTVSCGCAVTGIMASRTIESEGERRATIFLAPMMPCGAKTAVFGWFAAVVFGGSALVAASAYFLSLFAVAVFGKILKKFKPFRGSGEDFLLEMPTLRAPSVKDVFFVLWEKTKDFLFKAGTVIFTASVVLWVLKNVGAGGYTGGEVEKSFLYFLGDKLKILFYPLGFSGWQSSVAIISGAFAKEAVVETLALLSDNPAALFPTKASAYAFLAFVLLSPPCVSALSVAKRELKSGKLFAFMLVFQFSAAYVTAFAINFFGNLFVRAATRLSGLIFSVIIVIIIATVFVCVAKTAFRGGCGNCVKHTADGCNRFGCGGNNYKEARGSAKKIEPNAAKEIKYVRQR